MGKADLAAATAAAAAVGLLPAGCSQDDVGCLHALLDLLVWQHHRAVHVQLGAHLHVLAQHALVLQPTPAAHLAVPADDALVHLQPAAPAPMTAVAARSGHIFKKRTVSTSNRCQHRRVQASACCHVAPVPPASLTTHSQNCSPQPAALQTTSRETPTPPCKPHLGVLADLHAFHHHAIAQPHAVADHAALADADVRPQLAVCADLGAGRHQHVAHHARRVVQRGGVVDVEAVQVQRETWQQRRAAARGRAGRVRRGEPKCTSTSPATRRQSALHSEGETVVAHHAMNNCSTPSAHHSLVQP